MRHGETNGWSGYKGVSACQIPLIVALSDSESRVQIQILLYFLKLSLPAPPQTDKERRKRKRSFSTEVTTEEYLEQFMDRLSMWQLLETVQSTKSDKAEERDWMQSFCEELVEPE